MRIYCRRQLNFWDYLIRAVIRLQENIQQVHSSNTNNTSNNSEQQQPTTKNNASELLQQTTATNKKQQQQQDNEKMQNRTTNKQQLWAFVGHACRTPCPAQPPMKHLQAWWSGTQRDATTTQQREEAAKAKPEARATQRAATTTQQREETAKAEPTPSTEARATTWTITFSCKQKPTYLRNMLAGAATKSQETAKRKCDNDMIWLQAEANIYTQYVSWRCN